MAPSAKRMKYDTSFKTSVAARKYGINGAWLEEKWNLSEEDTSEEMYYKISHVHWPKLENYLEG